MFCYKHKVWSQKKHKIENLDENLHQLYLYKQNINNLKQGKTCALKTYSVVGRFHRTLNFAFKVISLFGC